MQFKQLLLRGKVARNFYRSYVSSVNVNVNSLNSIRVVAKDVFAASSEEVNLTILDSNKTKVDASNFESLRVVSTGESFQIECSEPQDISVLIEIPLSSSPEVNLEVKANSSLVHVENLPTKNVDLRVESGDILINNIKGDLIKAETGDGNITTKGTLLGKLIQLTAKNGMVTINKTQGDELQVDAKSIKISSCYSKACQFTSTNDAFLKNVHSDSVIKSSGESFKLSGFSGTIKADIDNEIVDLQLSAVTGESKIKSIHPNAVINLGLAEDVVDSTHINVSSNAAMESYIDDLMVYHIKKKNLYEVKRVRGQSKNHLNFFVKGGKSIKLYTMSWIDFIKFV